MSNFMEVIPGVCISTRRIVSVEAQEHDGQWIVLIFTDLIDDDGKAISYIYNNQLFGDKEAAMVKLAEIVGKCGGKA